MDAGPDQAGTIVSSPTSRGQGGTPLSPGLVQALVGGAGYIQIGPAVVSWDELAWKLAVVVRHRAAAAGGVMIMFILDVILGVAVLALLIYRQLAVRPVNASAALRLIAILLVIGLLQPYRFLSKTHAHPLTFAAIGGSLVLAAIFGALRAGTVRVWLDDGQAWSQGNWLTATLWIASLAAHLGYDILLAHGSGVRGLGVATIVLYLAISLGFQRVLVLQRARRLQLAGPAAAGKMSGG